MLACGAGGPVVPDTALVLMVVGTGVDPATLRNLRRTGSPPSGRLGRSHQLRSDRLDLPQLDPAEDARGVGDDLGAVPEVDA